MSMSPERKFKRDVKILMHLAKSRGWNPYYFKMMCESVVIHLGSIFDKLKGEKEELDKAVDAVMIDLTKQLDETPVDGAKDAT